ncbi:MAG: dihydrodipicolinate synthase family protein [Terriglobia bacterium]
MTIHLNDYERRRKPGRAVQGISAVLLPYRSGRVDEPGFRRHLSRTLRAGLRPAVNMDTGYVDLLTPDEKRRVLAWTREAVGEHDWFAAGALPSSGATSGSTAAACAKAYLQECSAIAAGGGVPVIFPSEATAALDDDGLIEFFRGVAAGVARFIAFELGAVFNPNGRIFSEPVLDALMGLPQCIGLKHSSLDRATELDRLDRRDRLRPGFAIYSGNDLAADMIEYGSDYLLGLSTFAPELFAARDRAWAAGDARYFDWRDLIQYLGWVAFRQPVPAYKHSAAIFLKLTGGLESDEPHPRAPQREEWDWDLLADAAGRLERSFRRKE